MVTKLMIIGMIWNDRIFMYYLVVSAFVRTGSIVYDYTITVGISTSTHPRLYGPYKSQETKRNVNFLEKWSKFFFKYNHVVSNDDATADDAS